ncbi:MAG: histone deacetylase [Verrucomicrobiota bacterium]
MPLACFYDPKLYLPLPPGHPFPMDKFPDAAKIVAETVVALGIAEIHPITPVPESSLRLVHTRDYIDHIRNGSLSQYALNRIGLPRHPHLFRRSRYGVSGTVNAAHHAAKFQFAANLAGGTHHAFADHGHGFCVFNDVAVAIKSLQIDRPDWQFLVVDTDAHQGNGTHAIFRGDSRVFTYSIHTGKNFPAKKEPGDCDVPLSRYADSQAYFAGLKATLPEIFAQLEPDFVFWISGADVHQDDRFGQLSLTLEEIRDRDLYVLQLIADYACRAVILYGGGYNSRPGMTAEIHAQTIRVSAQFFSNLEPANSKSG